MGMMTDNEKAAIAAGLWKPHSECPKGAQARFHRAAPDMHDPANLWRALENVREHYDVSLFRKGWVAFKGNHAPGNTVYEADLFAALVALYGAEHPK